MWRTTWLAVCVLVFSIPVQPVEAFTIRSGFSRTCHERISAEAFASFLDVPIPADFPVPEGDAWRSLAAKLDDLVGEELNEDQRFIAFSLVTGVRDPDTEGHSVADLEAARSLAGDPRPEGQYLHALRGVEDDGPEGDVAAVEGMRNAIRTSFGEALAAAEKPLSEQIIEARVTLDFYNEFKVEVWEPAFRIGRAAHTLQDSFAHSIRSDAFELRKIAHVSNFVEAITTDFNETRDGIAHSKHVDRCGEDDIDEILDAASVASVELMDTFLRANNGEDVTIDQFLDDWVTLQPGCTFENDFCDNGRWLAIFRQDPSDPFLPDFLVCSADAPASGQRSLWIIALLAALALGAARSRSRARR